MGRASRRKLVRLVEKTEGPIRVAIPEAAREGLLAKLDMRDVLDREIAAMAEGVARTLGIDFAKNDWTLLRDASAFERRRPAAVPASDTTKERDELRAGMKRVQGGKSS